METPTSPAPISKPAYQQGWFAILFLLLFAPIGIWAMWKYQPGWPKFIKGCVSLFFGLMFLSALGNATNPKGSSRGADASQSDVSSTSTTDTESSRPQTTESTPSPSSVKVSATTLYAAYKANEVAADNTYKGKEIIVSGTVDTIGKDILNTAYVTLKSSDEIFGVQCMFDDANNSQLARLSKGDHVQIRGTCNGKAVLNVVLADSTLQ